MNYFNFFHALPSCLEVKLFLSYSSALKIQSNFNAIHIYNKRETHCSPPVYLSLTTSIFSKFGLNANN